MLLQSVWSVVLTLHLAAQGRAEPLKAGALPRVEERHVGVVARQGRHAEGGQRHQGEALHVEATGLQRLGALGELGGVAVRAHAAGGAAEHCGGEWMLNGGGGVRGGGCAKEQQTATRQQLKLARKQSERKE